MGYVFPSKFTVYKEKGQVLMTSGRTSSTLKGALFYLRFGTRSPTRIILSKGVALHQWNMPLLSRRSDSRSISYSKALDTENGELAWEHLGLWCNKAWRQTHWSLKPKVKNNIRKMTSGLWDPRIKMHVWRTPRAECLHSWGHTKHFGQKPSRIVCMCMCACTSVCICLTDTPVSLFNLD